MKCNHSVSYTTTLYSFLYCFDDILVLFVLFSPVAIEATTIVISVVVVDAVVGVVGVAAAAAAAVAVVAGV